MLILLETLGVRSLRLTRQYDPDLRREPFWTGLQYAWRRLPRSKLGGAGTTLPLTWLGAAWLTVLCDRLKQNLAI